MNRRKYLVYYSWEQYSWKSKPEIFEVLAEDENQAIRKLLWHDDAHEKVYIYKIEHQNKYTEYNKWFNH